MNVSDSREAAFVARVTASTTHEMRNVLAIVKESAGLIEDMVHAYAKRGALNEERLLRAVGRIDAQVARGAEIVAHLNRFAHSLDHTRERIDLDGVVRQVAFLGERFARQGTHKIEVRPGNAGLAVEASALLLQMALFAGIECCLNGLSEPATAVLRVGLTDGSPSIEFASEVGGRVAAGAAGAASGWGQLVELVGELGASLVADDAKRRFRLTFPGAVNA